MNATRPMLLLRARVRPEARPRFDRWFHEVHLRDVRRIPGMAEVEAARTPAGTHLGLYTFESAEVVQAALDSPQAAYARGTWSQWANELQELSIEILSPLPPMAIYQSTS